MLYWENGLKKQSEQIVISSLHSLHTLAMQKEWIYPIYLEHLKKVTEGIELPLS